MSCVICEHINRKEIEQDLLLRNFGDAEVTFKTIADTYNVPVKDLRVHALLHMSIDADESIVEKIKFREAGLLRDAMTENFALLKNLGGKINVIVSSHEVDNPTFGQINKAIVDLYLGCNQAIREAADSLVKMNQAINGEQNKGLEAFGSLIRAINPGVADGD